MGEKINVSIIIPCRNEEKFISKCLDSVIAQDYPKDRLEVFVVDGMSNDKTIEIAKRYVYAYPFIKILNNPKKIIPSAMNIGIKNAIGDVIMKVDAHASYEKYYVSKCVKYLIEYSADNVGGICRHIPRKTNLFGRGIANALSFPFGVGNSYSRIGCKEPIWVDSAFGGCYRKEVFNRIGLYDENIELSEDISLNSKLRVSGGRILLVPEIIIDYYARSDIKSFWQHNWRNGVWAIMPFIYSEVMPVRMRHLVPLVFILSLLGSAIVGFFWLQSWWICLTIGAVYSMANLSASFFISWREKHIGYIFVLPLSFGILHFGYGLGSLWGGIKLLGTQQFWNKIFYKTVKQFKRLGSSGIRVQ